jgi:hypothetical protein
MLYNLRHGVSEDSSIRRRRAIQIRERVKFDGTAFSSVIPAKRSDEPGSGLNAGVCGDPG